MCFRQPLCYLIPAIVERDTETLTVSLSLAHAAATVFPVQPPTVFLHLARHIISYISGALPCVLIHL